MMYIAFGVYFGICSVVDVRKQQIGWLLLLAGLPFVLACQWIITAGVWERAAGILIGMIFFAVCAATKGAIGMADCILIFYLGSAFGYRSCLQILAISFFLCAVICQILLLLKHMKRKQRIAFVPFLCIGYWACFLAGAA